MFFLKFLGIHCSLIKKHDFFVFLQNEGIFVATLDDKGGGGGGGGGGENLSKKLNLWGKLNF